MNTTTPTTLTRTEDLTKIYGGLMETVKVDDDGKLLYAATNGKNGYTYAFVKEEPGNLLQRYSLYANVEDAPRKNFADFQDVILEIARVWW